MKKIEISEMPALSETDYRSAISQLESIVASVIDRPRGISGAGDSTVEMKRIVELKRMLKALDMAKGHVEFETLNFSSCH